MNDADFIDWFDRTLARASVVLFVTGLLGLVAVAARELGRAL